MIRQREGFTIVEVLIAVVMLSIGILAMASGVGGVERMMNNGKRKTQSYTLTSRTLDSLRNKANSTNPKCTTLVNGSYSTGSYGSAIALVWSVANSGISGSTSKIVTVRTSYQLGKYTKGDTLVATVSC